jgi:hypothetical protein
MRETYADRRAAESNRGRATGASRTGEDGDRGREEIEMGYIAAVEMRFYMGDAFALEWHLQYNHYPPISLAFLPVARKALRFARNSEFDRRLLMPTQELKTVREIVDAFHLYAFLEGDDA